MGAKVLRLVYIVYIWEGWEHYGVWERGGGGSGGVRVGKVSCGLPKKALDAKLRNLS